MTKVYDFAKIRTALAEYAADYGPDDLVDYLEQQLAGLQLMAQHEVLTQLEHDVSKPRDDQPFRSTVQIITDYRQAAERLLENHAKDVSD